MEAYTNLKKGRVAKRLVVRGRQLFEITVYNNNSVAELQYGLRKNALKDKGYRKFSMIQLTGVKQKVEKAKPKEVKVFGRRVLL